MYTKTETSKKYISVTKASEIVGRSADELELLCRGGKVHSKIIAGEWCIAEDALSEYFNLSLMSVVPSVFSKDKGCNTKGVISASVPFSVVLGKTVNILTAFTLIFGGYYTVATPEGRSAGMQVVGYVHRVLDNSTDMMAFAGYSILDVFRMDYSKNALLAQGTSWFSTKQEQQSKSLGLLVVPATGEDEKDKVIREQIQNSFSDEVEVLPDKDGKSGIIKPVFKNGVSKSYLYVMVPVGD